MESIKINAFNLITSVNFKVKLGCILFQKGGSSSLLTNRGKTAVSFKNTTLFNGNLSIPSVIHSRIVCVFCRDVAAL